MPKGHTIHGLTRMMSTAVDEGRIVTSTSPSGPPYRKIDLGGYKQAVCYDCGTSIEVATIGGRTSYSCPRCQQR
jgi:formamidopyrimidine-DNA glycosylase